jgi:hypothetical protein
MKRWHNFLDIKDRWITAIQPILEDNLLSVIGHRPSSLDRATQWEVSLVLKDNSLQTLLPLRPALHALRHGNLSVRYFFSQEYLERTVDVYPVEYLTIQKRDEVLFGLDCFADMQFDFASMRLELEREMRKLKLHLRHEYLFSVDVENNLNYLTLRAALRHQPYFNALAYLMRGEYSVHTIESVEYLTEKLGLGDTLMRLFRKDLPEDPKELQGIFECFLEDMEAVVQFVDLLEEPVVI